MVFWKLITQQKWIFELSFAYLVGRSDPKPPQFTEISNVMGPRHPHKGISVVRKINTTTKATSISPTTRNGSIIHYAQRVVLSTTALTPTQLIQEIEENWLIGACNTRVVFRSHLLLRSRILYVLKEFVCFLEQLTTVEVKTRITRINFSNR